MALLIGQPMNGRDLEQAISPWPPERFAAMCDALAWTVSGRQCPSLPSFPAQVNAKDGGIDAEWSVELPDDGHPVPTPLLGPGWIVFQYKKRDLIAQDRRRIITNLKSSLTGAVSEIVEKTKRHPDRYVLFVNVDLKGSDKLALQETILKGYSDQAKAHVNIVGAGELVAFLNNHPHLRAAYFAPLLFKTWEEAHHTHLKQELIGTDVDLNMDELRSHIRDKHSAQHLWAIGRVLKYAPWEDIRRLLTVEDIADALPYTDLPEKKRQVLERALEIWRYGK